MKLKTKIFLILICIVIVILPFIFHKASDFEGADALGKDAIHEVDPEYNWWTEHFFEPSAEVESFLFATQAAIGAGFIGYYVGKKRGASKESDKRDKSL